MDPNNCYTLLPDYYIDQPFTYGDCDVEEIWSAQQQKWWCEIAKGRIFSTAIRCCACRKVECDRKKSARRVHLEGVGRKLAR
ncbi:MAG: zinc-ribbon domain containing protein [Cyanophyceae cyanobacterium]